MDIVRGRRALEKAGVVVLLLVVAARLVHLLGTAWDFEVYYQAARAVQRGFDPYQIEHLSAMAGRPIDLPYLYAPIVLPLFAPFIRFPLETAAGIWLALQLGLTGALLVLWRRQFVPDTPLLLFLAVAFLGLDAALFTGLRVGNVTALEQCLLWAGFACWIRDRRVAFALLVVAASLFKLLPIAFLGLLLVPTPRREGNPGLATAALGLFLAAIFLPMFWGPAWAREFLSHLPAERPTGWLNPSALGLIDTLLGPWAWTPIGTRVAVGLWAGYAIALLVVSRSALRATWRLREPHRWIVVAPLLFVLLSPRTIIYSYALLVVPLLLAVPAAFPRGRHQAAVWALVIGPGALQFLPGTIDWGVLGNLPFLIALGVWLLYRRRILAGSTRVSPDYS